LAKNYILITGQKGWLFSGENCFFLPPPPTTLGQNVGEKIKYIYPGKKDGYIWEELKKLTTPPYVPQNIAHDLFTYGLFK